MEELRRKLQATVASLFEEGALSLVYIVLINCKYMSNHLIVTVYTWGRGYCGALGHGDENDKTSPTLIYGLKNHLAVQPLGLCKEEEDICFDGFRLSVCFWVDEF